MVTEPGPLKFIAANTGTWVCKWASVGLAQAPEVHPGSSGVGRGTETQWSGWEDVAAWLSVTVIWG